MKNRIQLRIIGMITAPLLAVGGVARAQGAFSSTGWGDPQLVPYKWVDQQIGPELRARNHDPLKYLAADMGGIQAMLAKYQTGESVQTKQRAVVARLDTLIEQLEKSCK